MPVWIFELIYILAVFTFICVVLFVVSLIITINRSNKIIDKQIEQALAIANKEGENETDNQW